jgi:1-acyl-sn-glycerol-3-phosphate acyltransferase
MADAIYRLVRAVFAPFRYELLGLENLEGKEAPCVFVSNHLKEVGPIQVMASFPVRLHPWAISDMMEYETAPAYLQKDFTGPTLGLNGRAGIALSTIISKLSVPLIRELGGIPVYRTNGFLRKTFELSIEALAEGKDILIFPEDPKGEPDPETGIKPFLPGFAVLAHLYSQRFRAEEQLGFYPIAVEATSKTIMIGKRELYDSSLEKTEAIQKFTLGLESRVREMYASLAKL